MDARIVRGKTDAGQQPAETLPCFILESSGYIILDVGG
jgi:hypothetical protein